MVNIESREFLWLTSRDVRRSLQEGPFVSETPLPTWRQDTTDDQPGYVAPHLPIIADAERAVTDRRGVATPVDWTRGGDVTIVPAVNDDEAKGVRPERRTPGRAPWMPCPRYGSPPRGSHRRLS